MSKQQESLHKLASTYDLKCVQIKDKPWGLTMGVCDESIDKFLNTFFPQYKLLKRQVSPRFLLVNANSYLSWQWHSRRSELWKVVKGPVGIVLSENDVQTEVIIKNTEDIIIVDQKIRHRLFGLKDFAIVAEVWINLDISNPSNAEDIVRVEDNYDRL